MLRFVFLFYLIGKKCSTYIKEMKNLNKIYQNYN
jgi:hypothetical protein